MLETPHVAFAAAIATKIPNPAISIPLSLASHFLLETVPHWNPHLNRETKKYGKPTKQSTIIAAVDATTALTLGSFIAYQAYPNVGQSAAILACCFASVLPDLLEAPYFFLGFRQKFFKKWIAIQKSIQSDAPVFWGMLTQVITVAAALYWIWG